MGINIKYYVISIAAIFISLGIGIFIGFNMNSQDLYLRQQEALIESLESRFSEFKKEKEILELTIQDLRDKKERQNLFIEHIFYQVIHEKLIGLNIALVETTDDYFYGDVIEALGLSGARVPIHLKYMDKIYSVDQEKLNEISQLIGLNLEKGEDFINLLNSEVSNLLVYKNATEVLRYMIDQGYIQLSFNYDSINEFYLDGIIIAGGGPKNQKNKIEQVDLNLINDLSSKGFNIVGIERLDVEQSFIPQLKKLNISTIDNVDSKIGKISLIYVLKGAVGHFGEKPSAEALAPVVNNIGSEYFE